jgi:hypothetical protein
MVIDAEKLKAQLTGHDEGNGALAAPTKDGGAYWSSTMTPDIA